MPNNEPSQARNPFVDETEGQQGQRQPVQQYTAQQNSSGRNPFEDDTPPNTNPFVDETEGQQGEQLASRQPAASALQHRVGVNPFVDMPVTKNCAIKDFNAESQLLESQMPEQSSASDLFPDPEEPIVPRSGDLYQSNFYFNLAPDPFVVGGAQTASQQIVGRNPFESAPVANTNPWAEKAASTQPALFALPATNPFAEDLTQVQAPQELALTQPTSVQFWHFMPNHFDETNPFYWQETNPF